MVRKESNADVERIVEELLADMKPSDREKRINFERRVATVLRGVLKKRLNVKFLKSRWFKDHIRDRFHECKVTLEFLFSQKIDLRKFHNANMYLRKLIVTIQIQIQHFKVIQMIQLMIL